MIARSLLAVLAVAVASVRADYDPAHLPAKTDSAHGQVGYNDCQSRYGTNNANANCQNIFINSIKDFCLWGGSSPNTIVGDSEEKMISWCLKNSYGTRVIPDGTILGAHFLKTPSYVQVTGQGDFTKINLAARDPNGGGELDPHGATGAGNPIGGLVFTRAFSGNFQQIHEWNSFMSPTEFCFRACVGPYAKEWCPHIYDVMGCAWNNPAKYNKNQWEQCDGTEGEWPGVYHGSTWYQGQKPTPPAQTPGTTSNCRQYASLTGGGPAVKVPSRRDLDGNVMATLVARAPEWEDDQ